MANDPEGKEDSIPAAFLALNKAAIEQLQGKFGKNVQVNSTHAALKAVLSLIDRRIAAEGSVRDFDRTSPGYDKTFDKDNQKHEPAPEPRGFDRTSPGYDKSFDKDNQQPQPRDFDRTSPGYDKTFDKDNQKHEPAPEPRGFDRTSPGYDKSFDKDNQKSEPEKKSNSRSDSEAPKSTSDEGKQT